jgi:hypothetical protein
VPGLRNARAKGRRLGRPRVIVDCSRIASLRGSRTFLGPDQGRNRGEQGHGAEGACRLAQNSQNYLRVFGSLIHSGVPLSTGQSPPKRQSAVSAPALANHNDSATESCSAMLTA